MKDFEYTSKKGGLQRELGVPLTPTPTVPITRVGVECGTAKSYPLPHTPKTVSVTDGNARALLRKNARQLIFTYTFHFSRSTHSWLSWFRSSAPGYRYFCLKKGESQGLALSGGLASCSERRRPPDDARVRRKANLTRQPRPSTGSRRRSLRSSARCCSPTHGCRSTIQRRRPLC